MAQAADEARHGPETVRDLPDLARRLGFVVFRRAADSTLRFLDVEGPCAERMGLSKATLVGDAYSFWTRVDPEDRRRVLAVLEEAVRKDGSYSVCYRLQASDGRVRSVREEGAATRGSDGEVESLDGLILAAAHEVTAIAGNDPSGGDVDSERMARRLENQQRLANMARDLLALGLDELDSGVAEGLASLLPISGADRSWLVASDPLTGVQEEWEWTDEGVAAPGLSMRGMDLAALPHAKSLFEAGRELLLTSDSGLASDSAEMRFLEARGCTALLVIPLLSRHIVIGAVGFEIVGRAHPWNDEGIALLRLGGEVFASAVSRKRAEQALRESRGQLLQAQKMEAVGTLAGGVAHDFNNQLSVILGNARFVRENVSEDSDLCDAMTDLERAGEYCAQLTRQLLSFSRHVPVEPRATSVSEVLRDVGELTAPLLSSDIGFEAVAHDDLDSVFVDRIQLQQVLVNLVVNARDAMPDGGNLSIRTALCDIGSTEAAHLHLPEPGVYVEFVVSDTGSGMDDATIGRIYEPFFTTKEQGKGTGLGLATVYGILKESGGAIQVDSALGEGTTFRILLPRPEQDSAESSPEFRVGARGGETLLLVEGDASVRRLMRRMLGRMGFQVLQAANGEEAIRIGQTHEGDIDVLVSDVSMPGIGGVELGRQLLESRPSLRVLLLTAHSMDRVNLPGARTLAMPFRQEELGWALDSLLRG